MARKNFITKAEALEIWKTNQTILDYLKDEFTEKLSDYPSPKSINLDTANNYKRDYGDEDDTLTEDGIIPEFEEKKLYESSISKSMNDKAEIYYNLRDIADFIKFTKALSNDAVFLDTDENQKYDPSRSSHRNGDHDIFFADDNGNNVMKYANETELQHVNDCIKEIIKEPLCKDDILKEMLLNLKIYIPALKSATQQPER